MISGTGSAIAPRTFNSDTTDKLRDRWTAGAMHHLIKALGDTPVAIVLDKHTGFAEVNVTLGGVRPTSSGGFQVLVNRVYPDGVTGGCWYDLFNAGAIITLGDTDARWIAVKTYREEQALAIRKLQDKMMAELGIDDRYQLPRGKWGCSSFAGYVHASFTPGSYTGPVRYTWERYSSDSLVAAK